MSDRATRPSRPGWLVPSVVLGAAVLLIGAAIALNGGAESSPTATGPSGSAPTAVQGPEQVDLSEIERRDETDLLAVGPVDAPVVLIAFSDYQCPYCARWNDQTLPLMLEHVEAGDLRIEWRDANVFGPDSQRAARAAYAAAMQDEFAAYKDALFAGGDTRSDLGESALVDLAADLGLDRDRFVADLASTEAAEQVEVNQQLSRDLGVYSTPAFLVGGQPIIGAQPSDVFQDAFASALAAAS